MPLPEGGPVRWPPEEYEPVLAQIATWSAWYSGDQDQLGAAYANVSAPSNQDQTWFTSVVGYIRSALRRWFHTPPANGRARQRVHIPLAGDIAAGSAGLLFSEPPTITVPEPDEPEAEEATVPVDVAEPVDPTVDPLNPQADPIAPPAEPVEPPPDPVQVRLDELFDDGVHATLQEAAEVCAALGGVFLRVTWDSEVADKPWLTAVHPDCAVPEWRSGKLIATTLWRIIRHEGQRVVRHLERHEKGEEGQSGFIRHAVYEGSRTELGNVVPLTDYPETAAIAEAITHDGDGIETGTDKLTCVYVPNVLPNRVWRHLPVAANLGVADICGLESLLDFLDMTYSAWARAVEQGKARLFMPQSYVKSLGAGEGAGFDIDTEIIMPVKALEDGDAAGLSIEQVQFPIPVAEFKATIDQLKTDITGSAGYSGRSFGLDQGVTQATATEVNSLDRKDLITRDRKICYWGPALADATEALTGVDAHHFPDGGGKQVRPDIEWPDGVSVDQEAEARTVREWDAAGAASTRTKVEKLHRDWTSTQVDAEVELIDKALTDPAQFLPGGIGTPPEEEEADAEEPAPFPVA